MVFSIDTTADTVTIDGVTYSVTSETDQAKLVMMSKIADAFERVARRL